MEPSGGSPSHDPPQRTRRFVTIALAVSISILIIASLLAVGAARHEDAPARLTGPALVDALVRQTAEVRELEFGEPVEPTFVTSEELAADIRVRVLEEGAGMPLPPPGVLVALRMLDEGTDLDEVRADAAASSVIGYYDPATRRLVVESNADTLSPATQITLVHELTHAITDQHFGLDAFLTDREHEDSYAAGLALVEGDATFVMGEWTRRFLSLGDQFSAGFESALSGVGAGVPGPAFLTPLSMFAYLDGLQFVSALHEAGGWEVVDDAYTDPPASTEEILHPEKYLAGGDPFVPADDLVTETNPAHYGEIGELFLRTMLALESVSNAFDAAAGWDGGAWMHVPGGSLTMVTRWDSEADAREFRRAMVEWAKRAYPESSETAALPGDAFTSTDACVQLTSGDGLTERLRILRTPCL